MAVIATSSHWPRSNGSRARYASIRLSEGGWFDIAERSEQWRIDALRPAWNTISVPRALPSVSKGILLVTRNSFARHDF
jgi:hypothetical protein